MDDAIADAWAQATAEVIVHAVEQEFADCKPDKALLDRLYRYTRMQCKDTIKQYLEEAERLEQQHQQKETSQ